MASKKEKQQPKPVLNKDEKQQEELQKLGFFQMFFDFYSTPVE